jgi:starch phosphorylase
MPDRINRLPELAYNLWWSWNPQARELFRRLDYPLWRRSQHNPVQMLLEISQEKLNEAAADGSFVMHYHKVLKAFDEAMKREDTWFETTWPEHRESKIAYFSAEFGLHNSLPIYSGGLGILSGDHTKEAGELGIPLIGVGFMYPQGYFRQYLPSHGWQEAVYEQLDFAKAPIRLLLDDNGHEIMVNVRIGDSDVYARVWQVKVGRTNLYLMDSSVEINAPWDRELTARLYSGGSDMRIKQEIMLGIGGVRLLRKLGINPAAWHMNEGHSAFLLLELLREYVGSGMSFEQARREVAKTTVFTTHTPVPAGHDAFGFPMMDSYFWGLWDTLGISRDAFMALGQHQESWGMAFNMTVLALRLAGQANGVSKLHGAVSRDMWRIVWPDREEKDVPITSVTNGIHVPTWISAEMDALFQKYIATDWMEKQDDPRIWQRVDEIPDDALWNAHVQVKHKLFTYLQERERARWVAGSHDSNQMITSGVLLDPHALTIGFARRFATYKRANLILRDLDRLRALLLDNRRPLQIIFAGKAHPADDPGKHLIQEVYNHAKSNWLGGRVAFVEDYNMHTARYLKQGVDVWLNTPRRPREASGTSGMKASLNGVPNFSVLDGWWVEAYNGANGWAIGTEEENPDNYLQDEADSRSIYETLENQIIPLYYTRDRDNVPRGWAEVMREAIRSNTPAFSMRRMLKEYTTELYINALNGNG